MKIVVSLLEHDKKLGKHWLQVDPGALLGERREEIRRANWEKRRAKRVKDARVRQAAGILFRQQSGHMLLLKRADTGEWSIPAGHIEENEHPRHAAHRESAEETGNPGNHEARKVDERTTNGVHFHTYVQPTREQFRPILNNEHTEYGWFHGLSLPKPLHPGLVATLHAMSEGGGPVPSSG